MADNVQMNTGVGGSIAAADEIGGVHHQRVKVQYGADGSATDVSSANPMPTTESGRPDINRVHNIVDGTISVGNRPDIQRVHNVVDGTISTVASVTDVVGFSARPDINRVHNVVDGTITVADITTMTARPDINRVHNVVDGTIGIKAGTADIGAMHDLSGTASLQQSLAGTFEGVSDLGKTLKSPIASRNIKVFAINLTTTAQVHTVAKFTNGAGAATEYWRYALQAGSQGIAGANLAVTPPGYLFACGSNTTLALHTDNASLVHYSVSYFLESA